MTQQVKDDKNPGASKPGSGKLAHWGRVAVMVLSCGMIYPNAMIEEMDVDKYDADNKARGK